MQKSCCCQDYQPKVTQDHPKVSPRQPKVVLDRLKMIQSQRKAVLDHPKVTQRYPKADPNWRVPWLCKIRGHFRSLSGFENHPHQNLTLSKKIIKNRLHPDWENRDFRPEWPGLQQKVAHFWNLDKISKKMRWVSSCAVDFLTRFWATISEKSDFDQIIEFWRKIFFQDQVWKVLWWA